MGKILKTPSILPIIPFDPAKDYNIEFIYQDNQAVSNRAIITNNKTEEVVYDSIKEAFSLCHTIPAGILEAGEKYLIRIKVFDKEGNSSNWSEPVLFICLTTPEFKFKNLTNGDIYRQANITLELLYSQENNEQLKNYQIIQYNSSKVKISSSETNNKENLEYTFYGLDNNNTYYFRAIGETQNGIPLDTGFVGIDVRLEVIPIDAVFQLDNDYWKGVVRLTFNIKDVQYEINGDDYVFSNGMVTLNNTSVIYNDGFSTTDDFSLFCQVNKVALGTFLDIGNEFVKLSALKMCDSYYCELSIKGSDFRQYEKLEGATATEDGQLLLSSDNDYITVVIRRCNGYYGLEII